MENGTPTHDAIADAREWLRQRDAHRTELRDQLEAARARVAEIEQLLAELGGEEQAKLVKVTAHAWATRRNAGATASIPTLILDAVQGTHGLTISGIVETVEKLRPGTSRTVIYPAAYRMAKDGRLRKRGAKYYPSEVAEPAGK